jgi:hypothetical protein
MAKLIRPWNMMAAPPPVPPAVLDVPLVVAVPLPEPPADAAEPPELGTVVPLAKLPATVKPLPHGRVRVQVRGACRASATPL